MKKIIWIAILCFPFAFFYYLSKGKHQFQSLPYFVEITTLLPELDFLKEKEGIGVIEWIPASKNTLLRNTYTKLASKKKKYFFISYQSFSNEIEEKEIKNYWERVKINLNQWDFFLEEKAVFEEKLKKTNVFFEKKEGDFRYLIVDSNQQIRGFYTEKNLKNIEEDLRLLYKK